MAVELEPKPAARIDASALMLSTIGAVLAIATISYGVSPNPQRNVLGGVGHWIGRAFFESLGWASYVFLTGWLVLSISLFRRRKWGRWLQRLSGWILLTAAATVLSAWYGSHLPNSPLVGAGGTVGTWLELALSRRLASPYAGFAIAIVVITGIVLIADRALLRLVRRTISLLRKIGQRSSRPKVAEISPYARPPRLPAEPMAAFARPQRRAASPEKTTANKSPIAHSLPGLPPLKLLDDAEPFPYNEQDPQLRERARQLEKTFTDFGLNVRVVGIHPGPVVTLFEVALETGLRLNKVTALADDIALSLGVQSVRVVPIPGKNTVGIEVPNELRAVVRLKELITTADPKSSKSKLPLFLGKDNEGRPLIYDLAEMPHLLIAGRTGTGKSVCMNAVILSLLMTRTPEDVRMIMIDPKMLELSEYSKIPHLMHPVVKDMKKAEAILAWAVDKMEERYDILSRARVRNIAGYNDLDPAEIVRRVNPTDEDERQRLVHPMPYIVIFIDEMNDLMMTMKKEVESHVIRLAQKSRAAGIHLIVATQKPTVDVITGLIKSNLPARICFQVASRTDSRVVLDEMGADKLLGKGDLLFLQPGTSTIIRAQGTYASDHEIQRVVDSLECEPDYVKELMALKTGDGAAAAASGDLHEQLRTRDELYEQAIEVVVREGRGSVSLLQRALGIGYGRAARLIDFMAEDGFVGNYAGSQAREVLLKPEEWEAMRSGGGSPVASAGAQQDPVHAG